MKLMRIILSFAILFAGCYTPTVVTSDTPQLDNKEIIFKLLWIERDGKKEIYEHGESYIISKAGQQHQRIENGYLVSGKLVKPYTFSKDFYGVLYDEQIAKVVSSEYDATLTWVVIGGVIGVVLVGGVIAIVATPTTPLFK